MLTSGLGRLIEPLSGRNWSRQEIVLRVHARIAQYDALGLQRGQRVFLHYGNTLEFFIDVLAIWHRGACAVPVDNRLTSFEVITLAKTGRPALCVWADTPERDTVNALTAMGVLSILQPAASLAVQASPPAPGELRLDDEALILFTSGTTGDPKGVVHTHRSLRARWTSLAASLGLEVHRRTLCLLPTHFGHGLICNCLFPWLYGQDLHVLPPFRADILVKLGEIIDQFEITFMSSVPTVWRLATRTSRPPTRQSLQRVFCGSAPLSGSLWQSVQQWTGTRNVMNAYGITETGSWLAGTTVGFYEPEDGLIGTAWGGVIRILKSRDTSIAMGRHEECGQGESGHVWVNTPALMKGYLDRDDLTAAVVSEGWFATGDIGCMDERGRLYLRGREREEINKGGAKVYPGDVDAVIERFDQTLDVCTFAVPDALLGEDVGAAVVLEHQTDDTMARLHAFAARFLGAHQLPKKWYVVSEIPRTSRGKVNRSLVAEHCRKLEAVPMGKLVSRAAQNH